MINNIIAVVYIGASSTIKYKTKENIIKKAI